MFSTHPTYSRFWGDTFSLFGLPTAGNSKKLFDTLDYVSSGPGIVHQLHFDSGEPNIKNYRLQIFYDGELVPSINVDFGTLFLLSEATGMGMLNSHHLTVDRWPVGSGVANWGSDPQTTVGLELRIPMPFGSSCAGYVFCPIGVVAAGSNDLYGHVDWWNGATLPSPFAGCRLRSVCQPYLTAPTVLISADYVPFDIQNCAGWFVSFHYVRKGATGDGYNDRNLTWRTDGTDTYKNNGTEDAWMTSYYANGQRKQATDFSIITNANDVGGYRFVAYRSFLASNGGLKFSNSCRLTDEKNAGSLGSDSNFTAGFTGLFYADTSQAFAPAAPRNLAITPGDTVGNATWDRPTSWGSDPLTGYLLTVQPGNHTYSVGATAVSAALTGLTNGVLCTGSIHGINAQGNGTESAGVTFTPAGAALTAGTASSTGNTNTTADLTATDATGGSTPYTYQWQRKTTGSFVDIGGATSLSLHDTGLTPNTTYHYREHYLDNLGASVFSNTVDVTTSAVDLLTGLQFSYDLSENNTGNAIAQFGGINLTAIGAPGAANADGRLFVRATPSYFQHADASIFQFPANSDWTFDQVLKFISAPINGSDYMVLLGKLTSPGGTRFELASTWDGSSNRIQLARYSTGNTANTVVAATPAPPVTGTQYHILYQWDSVNRLLGISVNNAALTTIDLTAFTLNAPDAGTFMLGNFDVAATTNSADVRMKNVHKWSVLLNSSSKTYLNNSNDGLPHSGLI